MNLWSTLLMPALIILITGCGNQEAKQENEEIQTVSNSKADSLRLAEGLNYRILLRWGDSINPQGQTFGFNNDFNCLIPIDEQSAWLWTNFEYPDVKMISNFASGEKTREQVKAEMKAVGGSIMHLMKDEEDQWTWNADDSLNRRIDAFSAFRIAGGPLAGSDTAIGMVSNCAGGLTPWGTVLSCEENTGAYFGSLSFEDHGIRQVSPAYFGWDKYFSRPPEHYGWVAEINPKNGEAIKHLALGRFAHESATVAQLNDKRVVVYMGDDGNDQCIYKFVGARPNSLDEGNLYVADFVNGTWNLLNWSESEDLQDAFKNQTELLIRCREAAVIAGGTPMNRPEDIEIDPKTGDIFVALTNNIPKGDYHGSILRIKETMPDALTFSYDIFLEGGTESGVSSPDNLAFDPKGNLWICTDRSGTMMDDSTYAMFGNNQLFVILRQDWNEPKTLMMASAPVHAEFTGPWFGPYGKSLFLSVQHPGEYSNSLDSLFSHWPDGNHTVPKPSLVIIKGPQLDRIAGIGDSPN